MLPPSWLFIAGRRVKYIFLAGSDHDYSPKLKERLKKKDLTAQPWAFAIEQATAHIVQSEHQAQLLHQHFARTATIVRNPINLKRVFPKQAQGQTILWVGRSDQIKRPKIALQLARCCTEFHFTLIMTLWEQNIFDDCMAEASTLPNVTLVPYVPYHEVERYFAGAKLLINTSVFEGFPNTFLQAGKYELPIVSLQVDPGEMLSRHSCGLLCNGNFEYLQKNVRQLMTTPTLYNDFSIRCLEYVRLYHEMDNIIDQYERAITSVLAINPNQASFKTMS
ncbi:MAG: glycosyltransferase family 4 protein [Anaerolineales bacterium]|nr:glycosyltransferase family 4 protein [Anaerolineales bacterium]